MKKRIGNKKGSIYDLIYAGVLVFTFAMLCLIGLAVYDGIDTQFQASDDLDAHAKNASLTMKGHFTGVMDNSILFLVGVLAVGTLAMAALIRVHPVFIFFFVIFEGVVIFLCGVWSNVYQEMSSNTALSAYASQLTMTTAVMTYLPFIVGVIGTLLSIVMYKGWSDGQ